jgi:hypothetical protein
MTTILETVTPKQIDEAIGLQCSTEFDRERFALDVVKNSPEFVEYVFMLSNQFMEAGVPVATMVASAITVGIEIGVSLVTVYERR